MSALTSNDTARLCEALFQQNAHLAELTGAIRMTVPQFYNVRELRDRWKVTRQQLAALLETHGGKGTDPERVPLDLVLTIDKHLRRNGA